MLKKGIRIFFASCKEKKELVWFCSSLNSKEIRYGGNNDLFRWSTGWEPVRLTRSSYRML